MNQREKIAVAGFNAFLGLMKSKLKTNKIEQKFQDLAHLSYIQFKEQKVFSMASEWIDFHFTGFSLAENGVELKK